MALIIQHMLNYQSGASLSTIADPPIDLARLARQLKALADPKRLLIVHMLMEGVQCNCELGDALQMAPNLISHHLRVLREAGLVDVERDALDARWVYYSINRLALDALNRAFSQFFDPGRMKRRRPTCGPQGAVVPLGDIALAESGRDRHALRSTHAGNPAAAERDSRA